MTNSKKQILHEGDKILLVGEVPRYPSVYYAPEMKPLLNNKKIYSIRKVHIRNGKIISIHAAGWNWDPQNIKKVSEEDEDIPPYKPILFDVNQLDLL